MLSKFSKVSVTNCCLKELPGETGSWPQAVWRKTRQKYVIKMLLPEISFRPKGLLFFGSQSGPRMKKLEKSYHFLLFSSTKPVSAHRYLGCLSSPSQNLFLLAPVWLRCQASQACPWILVSNRLLSPFPLFRSFGTQPSVSNRSHWFLSSFCKPLWISCMCFLCYDFYF